MLLLGLTCIMSLCLWLVAGSYTHLPLPKDKENSCFAAVNKEVVATITSEGGKRKRKPYHHCVKMAKYACENGNKFTVFKFSAEVGHLFLKLL